MSNKDKRSILPQLRFPEFHNSPAWNIKHLGELVSIGNGRDYKHLSKGSIPVYGTGGYMLSVDDYLYDGESVCIGRKGTIDKPIFLTGKFWTVDTLFYTHSFRKCLPKFVYLLFQNISWLNYNAASGVPSLSKTTIEKIEVSTPALEEQQKIADCLSSIDELITAESKKLDALKTYKKGLMQQLFPAEGETLPKLRFPEFQTAPKWEKKAFEQLVEVIDGDRGVNYPKSEELKNVGYCLFLNAKNVTKFGFQFKEMQFIDKEKDETLRKGKLQRADIVLTTRGSVGQFAFFSDEIPFENMRLNSGMVILRVKSKKIDPLYLYYFCKSEFLEVHIKNRAFGNAQQQLTVAEIKNFHLYYPSVEEQEKITRMLSSVDTLITNQSKKMNVLKNHKQGLMQQLFPTLSELKG